MGILNSKSNPLFSMIVLGSCMDIDSRSSIDGPVGKLVSLLDSSLILIDMSAYIKLMDWRMSG